MKDENQKQVGSNLTGAAIPAKPGHQRDIPVDQYKEENGSEEKKESPKHIENTDALLGDVHPTDRDKNSQEERNAENEKK